MVSFPPEPGYTESMSRKYAFAIAGAILILLFGGVLFWYQKKVAGKTIFTNQVGEQREEALPAAEEQKPLTEESDKTVAASEEKIENPAIPDKKEEETKEIETEAVSQTGSMPVVVKRLMSSGYAASDGRKIDTIILHSSYDALGDEPYSVSGLIKEYEEYGVSAHYLIDRKGVIYQLVADKNVSYHAGVSKVPDGRSNVNDFSIGIEMMTTEKEDYTNAQYGAVQKLVDGLKSRYAIKYVLGHDDIAPGRKSDPWNFDWKKLKK